MTIDKLRLIAETKQAFGVTTEREKAHDACWLLYGSFYRLFCHLDTNEGPLNLGWGQKYPRDLLALTQTVAGRNVGKPLRQLNDFGREFNSLSISIPAEKSRDAVSLQDIRNFGGLLLEGQELITINPAASEFVIAKSKKMYADLDAGIDRAYSTLVQRTNA